MARHYLPTLKDTKSVKLMDRKLTQMLIECTILEHEKGFEECTFEEANKIGPVATLLWRRLAGYGKGNTAKISIGAFLFVVFQIKSPGDCTLWGFTLNRMWSQNGLIDLDHLTKAFPDGFPDERGKEEIWDSQKCSFWGEDANGSDNMLDHPEYLTDTENFIEKKEWCRWLQTT